MPIMTTKLCLFYKVLATFSLANIGFYQSHSLLTSVKDIPSHSGQNPCNLNFHGKAQSITV